MPEGFNVAYSLQGVSSPVVERPKCICRHVIYKQTREYCCMRVHCNAGWTVTSMIGWLPRYPGEVWYNPDGIANILSFANLSLLCGLAASESAPAPTESTTTTSKLSLWCLSYLLELLWDITCTLYFWFLHDWLCLNGFQGLSFSWCFFDNISFWTTCSSFLFRLCQGWKNVASFHSRDWNP